MSIQTAPAPQKSITVKAVRQRRVPRGLLFLAVAIMAVTGLGVGVLVIKVANAQPYLAIARDVPIGAQLTEADLRVVYINNDPGLVTVPAAEKSRAIGKYTLANLTAGSLLSPKALSDKALPGNGQQLVGISVKQGRIPPGLKPGASIVLVATAAPNSGANGNPPPPLPTIPATVIVIVAVNNDTLLSVAVEDSDAATAARLAAEGRLVITLAGS